MLTAFADESGSVPLACYLLGAVILDDISCNNAREVMLDLRLGHGKIHWHTEGPSRRRKLVEAIADIDHLSIVAVGRGADRRQERARHKCFETLLPELEAFGVTRAVFETRGAKPDSTDLAKVAACRIRRLITGQIAVEFDDPHREPLLWLPDVVCGALLAEEAGYPAYVELLRDKMLTTEADVR
jgi:hypothetical protein